MADQPKLYDDFADMLAALSTAQAEYLVVGGHAVAAHGVVRGTLDIDIFVRPSEENAQRVVSALRAWGAPIASHGVSAADFAKPDTVYQLGLPPRRIDILTSIDGVSFDEACEEQIEASVSGIVFPVIGRRALLANKRASGRHKDLGDVDALEGR